MAYGALGFGAGLSSFADILGRGMMLKMQLDSQAKHDELAAQGRKYAMDKDAAAERRAEERDKRDAIRDAANAEEFKIKYGKYPPGYVPPVDRPANGVSDFSNYGNRRPPTAQEINPIYDPDAPQGILNVVPPGTPGGRVGSWEEMEPGKTYEITPGGNVINARPQQSAGETQQTSQRGTYFEDRDRELEMERLRKRDLELNIKKKEQDTGGGVGQFPQSLSPAQQDFLSSFRGVPAGDKITEGHLSDTILLDRLQDYVTGLKSRGLLRDERGADLTGQLAIDRVKDELFKDYYAEYQLDLVRDKLSAGIPVTTQEQQAIANMNRLISRDLGEKDYGKAETYLDFLFNRGHLSSLYAPDYINQDTATPPEFRSTGQPRGVQESWRETATPPDRSQRGGGGAGSPVDPRFAPAPKEQPVDERPPFNTTQQRTGMTTPKPSLEQQYASLGAQEKYEVYVSDQAQVQQAFEVMSQGSIPKGPKYSIWYAGYNGQRPFPGFSQEQIDRAKWVSETFERQRPDDPKEMTTGKSVAQIMEAYNKTLREAGWIIDPEDGRVFTSNEAAHFDLKKMRARAGIPQ